MKEFLQSNLIEIGEYTLKIHNVISFIIFVGLVIFLLVVSKHIIYKSKTLDIAKKFSISKLFRYIIISVSWVISLHLLGFNVSVLMAGATALLVGLGFGLQNLFNDFISGVVLLLDGTLKVGDIIEVNSMIYKVEAINFRTTTVLGRDENYIILPNSELTSNRVVNWTHSAVSSRFRVTLGIEYTTDVPKLMQLLKEVVKKNQKVLMEPEPFVRFDDFGDSALIFSVFFYTNEVFRVERLKSDIRLEILKTLRENNIHIPFPQRVVHIKSE